jgi:hypothetical protein
MAPNADLSEFERIFPAWQNGHRTTMRQITRAESARQIRTIVSQAVAHGERNL